MGGGERHILIFGGGRSGKTFVACQALCARSVKAAGSRHAIFRHRFNAVKRSIGMDTMSKVLALCYPGLDVRLDRTDWVFKFPNGSEIWLAGLDDKERTEKILGQEFASLYFNECSQIKWQSIRMARTRLAQKTGLALKAYYDLNPTGKKHWTYRLFVLGLDPESDEPVKEGIYTYTVMNPRDNLENLAPEVIEEYESLPERDRIRFLDGQYVDEVEGALFTLENLVRNRRSATPDLERIVVSIDPSGSSSGDETGIIVSGRAGDAFYVLKDLSGAYSPVEAARVAIRAYEDYQADAIVWETNFGKDWVKSTIRATVKEMHRNGEAETDHVALTDVTVFRGKVLRAQPIADRYELNQVHHLGTHSTLESEMTSFTHTWDRSVDGSPNRLDALVMSLTELGAAVSSGKSLIIGKKSISKPKTPTFPAPPAKSLLISKGS